jgi:carboxymethylenebutenolidase
MNVTLTVSDRTEMNVYVARPSAASNKSIIVFQEAFGVNSYIRSVVDRFAAHGFLAVAPELFHRTGPGFEGSYTDYAGVKEHVEALTEAGLAADAQASYDWLLSEGMPVDRIAAIGFCMGGRASFIANAKLPLAAAISFYGGGIAPALLPRAPELRAPHLFAWGGKDTHILPEHRHAISEALTAAGKPFVDVVFSEANHGFACDVRAAYHEPSAREAWALTDAFLTNHLP